MKAFLGMRGAYAGACNCVYGVCACVRACVRACVCVAHLTASMHADSSRHPAI